MGGIFALIGGILIITCLCRHHHNLQSTKRESKDIVTSPSLETAVDKANQHRLDTVAINEIAQKDTTLPLNTDAGNDMIEVWEPATPAKGQNTVVTNSSYIPTMDDQDSRGTDIYHVDIAHDYLETKRLEMEERIRLKEIELKHEREMKELELRYKTSQ